MDKILRELEKLQRPSGAFVAAPSLDYHACWIRDQLYTSYCYYYINEFDKLKKGVSVIFDILHKHRPKTEEAICIPPDNTSRYINAKYHPDTLEELHDVWGHHQLDAIGLFLYIVADLDFKNISMIRNKNDSELIQLLVFYLLSVRYWEKPDNGMWEENFYLHSSSIGSALAGLLYIQRRELAIVPTSLIALGREALNNLLPNESPNLNVDMAQLSLIWPYNIVSTKMAEKIISNIKQKLVQKHGLNRYWGDNYFRSKNGISGEWPLGLFWLSIIYSQQHDIEEAKYWFDKGLDQVDSGGRVPEIYQDEKPNLHTPLAWAQSFAIIAKAKLDSELQKNKRPINSGLFTLADYFI